MLAVEFRELGSEVGVDLLLLVEVVTQVDGDRVEVGQPVRERFVDRTHLLQLLSALPHLLCPAQKVLQTIASQPSDDGPVHVRLLLSGLLVVDLALANCPQKGSESGGGVEGGAHELV
jgi:hypothetical protein